MTFKSIHTAFALVCALLLVAETWAGEDRQPVPLEMPPPAYPRRLFRKPTNGRVVDEFIIDTAGRARDAKIVQSTDPLFDQPALDATRKWLFRPGMKNGRVVNSRVQQALEFHMPEIEFIYPFEQLQKGIDGTATIGFWLDENAGLKRTEVLTASDPVFGQAAVASLEAEYAASTDQRLAQKGMMRTTLSFKSGRSGAAYGSRSAREILTLLGKSKYTFPAEADLDKPLVPVAQEPPVYPLALREAGPAGTVTVEFFVDREGKVQLPRVVAASQEAFGYAAAQAVGQWRYEAPKKAGKPVIAKVQIPIQFQPPTTPAGPEKSAAPGPMNDETPRP